LRRWSAAVSFVALSSAKSLAQVIDQPGEGTPKRLAPGHQHVIVIGLRLKGTRGAQGLFQPAADAVAHDSAADLPCHGDSDSGDRRPIVGILAARRLERKRFERASSPA
jgi:hypothetical protein